MGEFNIRSALRMDYKLAFHYWVEHHQWWFFSLPGYCSLCARCGVALMKEVIEDFGKVFRSSFVVLVIDFNIKFLFGVFPAV